VLNFQPHPLNRKYCDVYVVGLNSQLLISSSDDFHHVPGMINTAATNPERSTFPLPVNGNHFHVQLAELSLTRAELELRKGVQALGTTLHNYTLKVNCEEP
jgi:hypothetical protein